MKTFAIALSLAALAAQAQSTPSTGLDPHARMEEKFQQTDRDHDGRLSLAEMEAAQHQRLVERFGKLDRNGDGGLTPDEMREAGRERFQAKREERMAQRDRVRALDTDHDQALSRAEIGDALPRLSQNFDRLDLNHDGKLTRDEVRQGRAELREAPAPQH